jgi:hypothetical protein
VLTYGYWYLGINQILVQLQCWGFGSSAILHSGSGSGIQKYLFSFADPPPPLFFYLRCRIHDLRYGMKKFSDPKSGWNILDPQHCRWLTVVIASFISVLQIRIRGPVLFTTGIQDQKSGSRMNFFPNSTSDKFFGRNFLKIISELLLSLWSWVNIKTPETKEARKKYRFN